MVNDLLNFFKLAKVDGSEPDIQVEDMSNLSIGERVVILLRYKERAILKKSR